MTKRIFLTFLLQVLTIGNAFPAHIYWDCHNDSEFTFGMQRNDANEIIIDNPNPSDLNFNDLAFDNPHSYDFAFNVRLRDGEKSSRSTKFLTASTPSASFGIAWDYMNSENYSAAMFQKVSENHFDEITRSDYFKITIICVTNGEQTIVKEITTDKALTFEPHKFNTIQVKAQDGMLTVSAGHTNLTTLFTTEYEIKNHLSASIIAGPDCRLTIKRIEFSDYPDKARSNQTNYTQPIVDQIIKEHDNDIYVGYWRYLDRNTDDNLLELGGKYAIAVIPTINSGYEILYISGASRFRKYWSPYMKKGILSSTPFYNNYDLHWFTADKSEYSDECNVSVSENIMTFSFPIQKSTIRFFKVIPSEENP